MFGGPGQPGKLKKPSALNVANGSEALEYLGCLGQGTSGTAYLTRCQRTGVKLAIKHVEDTAALASLAKEVRNLYLLRHPLVVGLHWAKVSCSNGMLMAMEYCPGGDLLHNINSSGDPGFSESTSRYLFQQLLCAIEYLHAQSITHRDLKLENLLLDDNSPPTLKVCDFGFSKSLVLDSVAKTRVGTPVYMAPEVSKAQFSEATYDATKCDIWSMAIVLHTMLVGEYPRFGADWERAGHVHIMEYLSRTPILPQAQDLLRQMLQIDPSARITLAGIRQHPWFLKDLPPHLVSQEAAAAALPRFPPPVQTTDDIIAQFQLLKDRQASQYGVDYASSRGAAAPAAPREPSKIVYAAQPAVGGSPLCMRRGAQAAVSGASVGNMMDMQRPMSGTIWGRQPIYASSRSPAATSWHNSFGHGTTRGSQPGRMGMGGGHSGHAGSRRQVATMPSVVSLCNLGLTELDTSALYGVLLHAHSLVVSHNLLRTIYISPECVANLRTLDISANRLDQIPAVFRFMNMLSDLDVSENQLTTIPPSSLPKALRTLQMNRNPMSVMPESLAELPHLHTLGACMLQPTLEWQRSLTVLTRMTSLKKLELPMADPFGTTAARKVRPDVEIVEMW